jgi:protein SCO1
MPEETATAPATDRRSFLTALLPGFLAPGSPPAPPPAAAHEDTHDTLLKNGRIVSYLTWPRFALTDQRGNSVDLYRDVIAGRTVIVSFFYTQCKGSCPVTMRRMLDLHTHLHQRSTPVRFLSITLEPDIDTPRELRSYAADTLPPGSDWHLLTGPLPTITALRRHLGFYDLDPAIDADPRRHAAMVLMGNDTTHRWLSLPAIATPRQWRSTMHRCLA